MKDSGRYKLYGIVNPLKDRICFAIPVFIKANKYYLQIIDDNNITSGFIETDTIGSEYVLRIDNKIKHYIGKEALYSFYFTDNEIYIDTRDMISVKLKDHIELFKTRPFLLIEISDFINDNKLRNDAIAIASHILQETKPELAQDWRKWVIKNKNIISDYNNRRPDENQFTNGILLGNIFNEIHRLIKKKGEWNKTETTPNIENTLSQPSVIIKRPLSMHHIYDRFGFGPPKMHDIKIRCIYCQRVFVYSINAQKIDQQKGIKTNPIYCTTCQIKRLGISSTITSDFETKNNNEMNYMPEKEHIPPHLLYKYKKI